MKHKAIHGYRVYFVFFLLSVNNKLFGTLLLKIYKITTMERQKFITKSKRFVVFGKNS